MAVEKTSVKTREYDFDHFVEVLIGLWEWVTEVEKEWATWDDFERLTYVEDWPSNKGNMELVEAYVQSHTLTAAQQAKYDHLHDVMRRNEPILRKLRGRPL